MAPGSNGLAQIKAQLGIDSSPSTLLLWDSATFVDENTPRQE